MTEGSIRLDELTSLLEHVQSVREQCKAKDGRWNKFVGDAAVRIVAHYLKKHLPSSVEVAMHAWAEGCSNELDLLIVSRHAKPAGLTGVYRRQDVHLIVEVKSAGLFYKRREVRSRLTKHFEHIRKSTGKPVLYLSLQHSDSYKNEVEKSLGNDAFILRVGKERKQSEWNRFLSKIASLLQARRTTYDGHRDRLVSHDHSAS